MRNFINVSKIINESIGGGDVQKVFQLGPVTFDNRDGIGNVPDCANVNYMGFAVTMTPKQFLNLAAPRDFNESSNLKGLIQALKDEKSFGCPFLEVRFDGKIPVVRTHEGRTRVKAIETVYGASAKVLVCVFPANGERARHITMENLKDFRKHAVAEKSKNVVNGPLFDNNVWIMNEWKTI